MSAKLQPNVSLMVFSLVFPITLLLRAKRGTQKGRKGDQSVYEPPFPRVLAESHVDNAECRWLALKKVSYLDDSGTVREWEKVERRTRSPNSDVDGVLIIGRISGGERDGHVPFVSQFRPATGRKTLELPAGLVDKGETIERAAVRELREETGYIGSVVDISPPLFLDPGMSSSALRVVTLHVDGNRAENLRPVQALDAGEFCEVMYLKNPSRRSINELAATKGLAVDANVYLCCVVE